MGGFVGAVTAANRSFRTQLEQTPIGEEFSIEGEKHLMLSKTRVGATIKNLQTGEEKTLEFERVWSSGSAL